MVERALEKEGLSRERWARKVPGAHLGLEGKYGGLITRQIRRPSASCDWTRERFTIDWASPGRARSLADARLYEKGSSIAARASSIGFPRAEDRCERPGSGILRRTRARCITSGHACRFRICSFRWQPPARRRSLGDTAVAVHPQDERYQQYIGQKVRCRSGRNPRDADEYVRVSSARARSKLRLATTRTTTKSASGTACPSFPSSIKMRASISTAARMPGWTASKPARNCGTT